MIKLIYLHRSLLLILLVTLTLLVIPLRTDASSDIPPEESSIDDVMVLLSAEEINPYFTVESYALPDGTVIQKDIINGPPEPPPGYEAERVASIQTLPERGTISDFPSYDWVFGCSAVSAAMIAGYHDRNGYPNIYDGPTNDGVMPLSDTIWGERWADCCVNDYYYAKNPLVASMKGLDGRTSRGTINNYWFSNNSTAPDPYITNGWTQHTWGTAVGDYMKTSQSAWPYQSRDGGTWFWNNPDATKLTCSAMESYVVKGETYTVAQVDGTYGRKRFYEARGYTVFDCYNQLTDTQDPKGFSLEDFKTEINAGQPVLLNLQGHTIVGYGYSGSTIYIRDTWDSDPNKTYPMEWGGNYAGMPLRSVSVVRLAPPPSSPPALPQGVTASDGIYYDKVRVSWESASDAAYYQVFRNTENQFSGAVKLTTCPAWNPFDDRSAKPEAVYYYWVLACNAKGCSQPSTSSTGQRGSVFPVYLPLMMR